MQHLVFSYFPPYSKIFFNIKKKYNVFAWKELKGKRQRLKSNWNSKVQHFLISVYSKSDCLYLQVIIYRITIEFVI